MYLHTPALEVDSWWRVDTASGTNTPTTVYAHDGADAIGTSAGTSGSTVKNSTRDGTGRFWSSAATLYCKQLTYQGVPNGTVVTSTGITPPAPPAPSVDIAAISTLVAALPTTYALSPTPGLTFTARPVCLNALDFGAKFDNTTDDTAAINAALAAAPSNPYSASNANDRPSNIVQLPPGRAKIAAGSLLMPPNTTLRGYGPSATYLVSNQVVSTIKLTSADAVQTEIAELGIICQSSGGGIDYANQAGGASSLGVSRHVFQNLVLIGGSGGDHLAFAGVENRVINVTSQRCGGRSLNVSGSDHQIHMFTSAQQVGTNEALYLNSANVKITNSKVYGAAGYSLNAGGGGRHTISAFEAQDCKGGITFGSNVSASSLLIDSCCDGSVGSAALTFNGSFCRADGLILSRVGGLYTTPVAFSSPSFVTGMDLSFTVTGMGARVWLSGPFAGFGSIRINGEGGFGAVAYAASYTPDPALYTMHSLGTLTGDIAIANPASGAGYTQAAYPGMKLAFRLTQDATGGHAVTWGTAYKTTGAIDTTANKSTRIQFEYDGTNWWESARVVI